MSTATVEKQNMVTDRRSAGSSISSEVMVAAIIFFFVVVVFVIFLHVYAKSRWRRMASASRRHPVINSAATAGPRRGLDLSVIASLPVSVFRSQDFKAAGGLECSVCLSELVDGEKVRILPKCNHGFHVDCIDMWFYSHSTCPLCRSEPLPFPEADYTTAGVTAANSSATPADVENPPEEAGTQVTAATGASSSEGDLVIEIPRRPAAAAPGFSSEDAKSPVPSTPTLNRLRSLRRILSREKKAPVPCCGASGDIEQGTIESEGGPAAGLSLR